MPTPLEWARHFRSRATECQRLAESVSSLSLQDHYTRLAQGRAGQLARPLGIVLPPPFSIPHMAFSSAVGKIDDERVCLKLIGRIASGCKCFAMRGKATIRDRKNCGLSARGRWLGKVRNG